MIIPESYRKAVSRLPALRAALNNASLAQAMGDERAAQSWTYLASVCASSITKDLEEAAKSSDVVNG